MPTPEHRQQQVMNVVHLTDSPFYGGPERQMLGLSMVLPPSVQTTILCFRDHASSLPFLKQLDAAGIAARMIDHENPYFLGMIADVASQLRREHADLLACHGYKAGVIGWFAARRVGIPVIAVSRGWTAHTLKVRAYEALDRRMLRQMDAVVCVSVGQAAKVARTGIARDRLHVIHNSVDPGRFRDGDASGRAILEGFFASPRSAIIAGVGRQSPEKGFDQLVDAARLLVREDDRVGIVLVGDGPDRSMLEALVRASKLESNVVFAGFRTDVDRLLPSADLLAQASHTEGLPNVVLEASAAFPWLPPTSEAPTKSSKRASMASSSQRGIRLRWRDGFSISSDPLTSDARWEIAVAIWFEPASHLHVRPRRMRSSSSRSRSPALGGELAHR
jgi:glycosyltransferase involved in cell wall biosynthesis